MRQKLSSAGMCLKIIARSLFFLQGVVAFFFFAAKFASVVILSAQRMAILILIVWIVTLYNLVLGKRAWDGTNK